MYYPKSQIKPNLYTNGKEYILSTTKENYIGYYYEISTGQKYTGKNLNNPPNILLNIPFNPQTPYSPPPIPNLIITQDELSEGLYNQSPPIRTIPLFNPTLPTDQDNQNGQFNRYFCKKNNELKYLEIDQNTYKQLQRRDSKIAWDLYTPIIVLWIIQGNQTQVYNSNKVTVQAIETNARWNGFSQYFQEKYLKYYISSELNNLYTSGGEFTTKNGQNYIGFYHMHNGITPMVGKIHTNILHDVLVPIRKPIIQQLSQNNIITSSNLPFSSTSTGGGSYSGGGSSMGRGY